MNFYPYLPNLLLDLWKARYKTSVHNAEQHLYLKNRGRKGRNFLMGVNGITCKRVP
jgi:hypothetical protein